MWLQHMGGEDHKETKVAERLFWGQPGLHYKVQVSRHVPGMGQQQHAPLRRCDTPSKSLSGVVDLNSRPPCAEGSLLPPLLSEKLSNSLPATSKSPMREALHCQPHSETFP